MSLLNFIKPKWQHKDPAIRLEAINSSDCPEQAELGQIILADTEVSVRQAALNQISDWHFLLDITNDTESVDPVVASEISSRIDQLKVDNVIQSDHFEDKLKALEFIDDENLLFIVASDDSLKEIRLCAAKRIKSEELLSELVSKKCGKDVSLHAVESIDNPELLEKVVDTASNRAARVLAESKLDKLSEDKAAKEKQYFDEHTAEILEQIKVLPLLADIEGAYKQSNDIHQQWTELNVPQNHESVEQYHDLREQVEIRYKTYLNQTDEEREKLAQLPSLLEKLASFESKILSEAENIDIDRAFSTYKHVIEEWQHVAGKLDEVPKQYVKRFNKSTRHFEETQKVIAIEKKAYDTHLTQLITLQDEVTSNYKENSEAELSNIEEKITSWSPQYFSKAELLSHIHKISETISEKTDQINRKIEKQHEEDCNFRTQLLRDVKELLGSDNIIAAEKKFEEIKGRWNKKDSLNASELNDFNKQFDKLSNDFKEFQQTCYENRDWQFWQHKNIKTRLIEQMIALEEENDLHKVFKSLKALQQEWRSVGPLRKRESDKLWKKFQAASERNFARCKEFFHELDLKAEQNAQQKHEIVERAQSYQDSSEWKKTTEEIKALQQEWKKIGRTPPGKEKELYQSFRKACDVFFNRRQEHYNKLDEQRKIHLSQKEELCEKLEKLVAKPDLSKKSKLFELQKQWKSIGPVPRENDEEIWARYRAATGSFYDWLDTLKPDNLEKKEKLCQEVETLCENIPDFSDEKSVAEFSRKIIDIQNQWKKIGPVPDDQKDSIWERFRGNCDLFFNQKNAYNKAIDECRPENEERKKELLAQLDDAVKENSKSSVRAIIKLQEDWKKIGPATKHNDFRLDKQFRETCNGFFKDRREVYEEMDKIRRENHKQKEALCVRLEILAGINVPQPKASNKKKTSLTLAEQLQLAFEENFILAGDDKDKSRRKKDELSAILEEWRQVGPVPKEHEFSLKKRYKKALSKLSPKK